MGRFPNGLPHPPRYLPARYCSQCQCRVGEGTRFCDQCGFSTSSAIHVNFGRSAAHGRRIPEQIRGIFGDYVLLEQIGDGGMGRVYKAMKTASGQYFALKVIRDALRGQRRAIELFEREAEAQSRIVHPNVVRAFGLAREGEQIALVCEWVQGPSLAQIIDARRTPLPIDDALRFSLDMCRGLSFAHAEHFVHADIKPSNFLLGPGDHGGHEVKLTDFGIARAHMSHNPGAGATAGTPGFMSPEQIRGQPLTPASDLYSLGCVFYEMLAHRSVFPAATIEGINARHLDELPPPPSVHRDGIPAWLDALVSRLLSKSPERRGFIDAMSLLQHIEASWV